MKRILLVWIMSFCALSVSLAQNTSYYYSGGEKINLSEDASAAIIKFKEGVSPSRQFGTRNASLLKEVGFAENKGWAVLNFKTIQKSQANDLVGTFGLDEGNIESISYAYQLDGGFRFWPTDHVVVKLKDGVSLENFNKVMEAYGAEYERNDFGTLVLKVKDMRNALSLSNEIYESGLVEFSHPDFYAPIEHHDNPLKYLEKVKELLTPSDPLFSEQFQMNNTGQTLDGFAGANDADCNAPQAWDISIGSSSITVAVIDDGVENHEDLGNVLTGYTPLTNGNGSPNASGAHGQSCAGIIAALHNGIGVAGLAPNVNILPVNIFAGDETNFETTQDLANAIRWAVDNGADVLSNSWGYPNSCGAQASNINSALQYAITNGRGGLGAVVIFSSGNDGATCVNYPAWRPEVVAVGAFGNDGIISEYSNQGSNLDITAPSDDVRATRFGNFRVGAGVRTIDREGSAGYDAGNYNPGFGGTSAACPVVSGVAALVLSVNPNLTESEVKNILYNTATDMGSNGFDNVYGNGRVNAFAAVVAAGGSNSNTPPVASFNANPTSGTAPLTVSFDASGSSDADGDGLSYSWNFGDGNSGSGLSPSHTYQNAGTFTATLTVDDGQATDQASVQITVGEPSGGGPEVISANSFETGWEDWNDGGEDCARPNNATWAFDGARSIRLRNGTSTSLTFSDPFDLAGYNSVEVDFYFVPRGMESTDSFSLQYNDGGGWQTVATFVRGNGYVNNSFYNETVTITSSSVNLTNGASFRFVNAGNARNDRVFLDLITITGSSSLSSLSLNNNVSEQPVPVQAISTRDFQGADSVEDVLLYPNPVSDMLRIKNLPDDTKIEIFNSLGQKVMTVEDEDELNMEKLERGLYVIKITREGEVKISRINKR